MVTLIKQRGLTAEPPAGVTVARYEWASMGGNWNGIKAETAATVLLAIAERDGSVTPDAVVDESRPADAPLHEAFEWNDRVAASAYRNEQARYLIKRIVTVYRREDTGQELPPTRTLVRLLAPEDESEFEALTPEQQAATAPKHYVPMQTVMNDATLRRQRVEQALRSLNSWRRTYADLTELARIFDAIDAAHQDYDPAAD